MKSLYQSIVSLLVITISYSCKKEKIETVPLGSLMIINAVPGGKTVKLSSYASPIANYASANFSLNTGEQDIYIWPEGDSLKPYYNSNKGLDMPLGGIYSLYLTGSPSAPEGIMLKEDIPYRIDSTAGIRFINLSPTGPAINVTLSSTPMVNEVEGLSYKQVTEFRTYLARANNAYTFQFRDAASNAILSTMSFTPANIPRFSNVTLAIRGLPNSIGILRINNDR